MKTRKLSSDEVLELVEKELYDWVKLGMMPSKDIIANVKAKINYIESIPTKKSFTKWFDNHQGSLWLFIMLSSVAFAAKVIIENYTFKN